MHNNNQSLVQKLETKEKEMVQWEQIPIMTKAYLGEKEKAKKHVGAMRRVWIKPTQLKSTPQKDSTLQTIDQDEVRGKGKFSYRNL